jgi:hypothetical protein
MVPETAATAPERNERNNHGDHLGRENYPIYASPSGEERRSLIVVTDLAWNRE